MGLVAWVADAAISWHFFPGKSFLEMLIENDPERTLYVRSTVVLLFFLFGYAAGHLVDRLESQQASLRASNKMLAGIRALHQFFVKTHDANALAEGSIPLLVSGFELKTALLCKLDPDTLESTGCVSNLSPDAEKELYLQLRENNSGALAAESIQVLEQRRIPDGMLQCMICPVRLDRKLFAMFYSEKVVSSNQEENENFLIHLESICTDLGFTFSHLSDESALAHNAEKLEQLTSTLPAGIFTSTESGKLLYLNPAMAKLLGRDSAEDVLNQKILVDDFYVDPERRESFLKQLRERGEVMDFVSDIKGLDGKVRTVVFAARFVPTQKGGDALIEGFALDITERTVAEKKNRVLEQEINQSRYFKSITVLAGGIAHEFNNILQAIMGSAYLAQLRVGDPKDETWGHLQDIQASGKRAAKLCDQMLSYAGKKAMMLKFASPDEQLGMILPLLRNNLHKRVSIEEKLNAPEASVRLDPPSFSEIVNQLISNAVESFPEEDSAHVWVETGICQPDEPWIERYSLLSRKLSSDRYWFMKVTDKGCGISPENIQHVLEPFFTTKFQGRGLGLSAVSGIVQKLDGSIALDSEPGVGTNVVLFLPMEESVVVEEDVQRKDPVDASALRKKSDASSPLILVVDDEPLICLTVERLLNRLKMKVETVGDGVEALEKLEDTEKNYSCMLLDVTMPRKGGYDTLVEARKLLPDLPVIIMSGFDESDSLDLFKGLNVAGFIHKPFRIEQLEEKLNQII